MMQNVPALCGQCTCIFWTKCTAFCGQNVLHFVESLQTVHSLGQTRSFLHGRGVSYIHCLWSNKSYEHVLSNTRQSMLESYSNACTWCNTWYIPGIYMFSQKKRQTYWILKQAHQSHSCMGNSQNKVCLRAFSHLEVHCILHSGKSLLATYPIVHSVRTCGRKVVSTSLNSQLLTRKSCRVLNECSPSRRH